MKSFIIVLLAIFALTTIVDAKTKSSSKSSSRSTSKSSSSSSVKKKSSLFSNHTNRDRCSFSINERMNGLDICHEEEERANSWWR